MRNEARGIRRLQAAGHWPADGKVELRERNEGRMRRSAGHKPRPREHKEEWLTRQWPRGQSIPYCVLHSTFLFSSWLQMERLVSAFVIAGERFQLVKKLGVALHGLQVIHHGGLSGGGRRMVPVGDAQISSSAHQ
jgi:hypothetical protein